MPPLAGNQQIQLKRQVSPTGDNSTHKQRPQVLDIDGFIEGVVEEERDLLLSVAGSRLRIDVRNLPEREFTEMLDTLAEMKDEPEATFDILIKISSDSLRNRPYHEYTWEYDRFEFVGYYTKKANPSDPTDLSELSESSQSPGDVPTELAQPEVYMGNRSDLPQPVTKKDREEGNAWVD